MLLRAGFSAIWRKGDLYSNEMRQYTAYCALWRTDGGFQSTIRLTNMLAIANVDAQVTLYMADGTPYPLPVVHVPASGVAVVTINDALASAPQAIKSHLSAWGSASISYRYDWQGVILASTSLLDLARSLQYVYPFIFPHSPVGATANIAMTLEGLWWKSSPNPHLFLGLKNTSAQPSTITVSILDSVGSGLSAQSVMVPGQGTSFTSINLPVATTSGGFRLQYGGSMDSLLVAAGIEDGTAGYSANAPLTMPGMSVGLSPEDLTFAAAGIMNGPADAMLGFPKNVSFIPYLYFRNTSTAPRVIHPAVNWMNGSAPQTIALPDLVLQPGEARQLPVPQFSGVAPEAFNFVYSYQGFAGDLLVATGSVDASGNYVFAVDPKGIGQSGGISSVYWKYGDGFDTMYTIWNPLSIAQQAQFLLIGGEGQIVYAIPLRLAPRASAMIDLYELFMAGKLDAAGRTMPHSPMHGSALLTGPKNDTTERLTLVINGGIYNARTATCGIPARRATASLRLTHHRILRR